MCLLSLRLQMTEAALALSEQKAHDLGELLTRVKLEKAELRDRQSREIKKQQEVFTHFTASYRFSSVTSSQMHLNSKQKYNINQ